MSTTKLEKQIQQLQDQCDALQNDYDDIQSQHDDLTSDYDAIVGECMSFVEYVRELEKNQDIYTAKRHIVVEDLIDELSRRAQAMKEVVNV